MNFSLVSKKAEDEELFKFGLNGIDNSDGVQSINLTNTIDEVMLETFFEPTPLLELNRNGETVTTIAIEPKLKRFNVTFISDSLETPSFTMKPTPEVNEAIERLLKWTDYNISVDELLRYRTKTNRQSELDEFMSFFLHQIRVQELPNKSNLEISTNQKGEVVIRNIEPEQSSPKKTYHPDKITDDLYQVFLKHVDRISDLDD